MKRKIVGIFLMILLIGTAFSIVDSEININSLSLKEIRDQYCEGGNSDREISGIEWQEFVPTMKWLSSIRVKLKRDSGFITGKLTISIKDEFGQTLDYWNRNINSYLGTSYSWLILTCDDLIELETGDTYRIEISGPTDSGAWWNYGDGDPYPNGISSIGACCDFAFQTYAEEVINLPPTVSISSPDNYDTVSGTIMISGEAHDPEDDSNLEWVKIRFDSGYWQYASGTSSWSYEWETTTVADGEHTISAKTFDGSLESTVESIIVIVDNGGGPTGQPDLIITDVWYEDDEVCYQIRNIGNASASSGHYTALSLDDEYQVSDIVNTVLSPGERYNTYFDYSWDCTSLNDSLVVIADYENDIDEIDETNNRLEELWNCDTIVPEIIYGPVAQDISRNSVLIYWKTNEECDSTVLFDNYAFEYNKKEKDNEFVLEHRIRLDNLVAGTTYHFIAESMDKCGNTAISKDCNFRTFPSSDNIKPSVFLHLPENLSGLFTISANTTDNDGIDRVEFYCDDEHLGNDYAEPFEWAVDSRSHGDGEHDFTAIAVDNYGNSNEDTIFGDITHYSNFCVNYKINIYPPNPDNPDDMQVYGVYNIEFKIEQNEGSCLDYWYCFINDDPVEWWWNSQRDSENCSIWAGTGPKPYYGSYSWDLTDVVNGFYNISIKAGESLGYKCFRNITVEKIDAPEELNLKIERRIEEWKHGFLVVYRVTNNDIIPISDIKITDEVLGFQVTEAHYDLDYNLDINKINTSITSESYNKELKPGDSRDIFDYFLCPILTDPVKSHLRIGSGGKSYIGISYQDPSGVTHVGDYPCNSESFNVEDIVRDCDYIIITNPGLLYFKYDATNVNILLQKIADLALARNAVIGYVPKSYDYHSDITRLIENNGLWSRLLRLKYVLLIGEVDIIPSTRYYNVNNLKWDDLTICPDIEYSDQIYSNSWDGAKPYYSVGRIIGNLATELSKPIQVSYNASDYTSNYDRSHALLISGTGEGQNHFVNLIEKIEKILNDKGEMYVNMFHWKDYPNDPFDRLETALLISPKDIIVFHGHGNEIGWSPGLDHNNFPLTLNTNPIIFAFACRTGDYEMGNIAENWFNSGAAVYIGSTEDSPGYYNRQAAKWFFNHWEKNDYIGDTFLELEKEKYRGNGRWWDYWIHEYNLYGDPKFGSYTLNLNNPIEKSTKYSEYLKDSPPSHIEIEIPNYEITTYDGVDYVDISGGSILLEEKGRPQVPYFTYSIDFPNEYQIQNIKLKERSSLTTLTGLNLPATSLSWNEEETTNIIGGWYPNSEMKYSWRIIQYENTATLFIDIYPFYYNPDTTNAEFYRNYEFDIEYIHSEVSITALYRQDDINHPGDKIIIDMALKNNGLIRDVITSVLIKKCNFNEVVYCLPLRMLKDFSGNCTNSVIIDTRDFEPSSYYVEVFLYDTSGNILANKNELFYIEIPNIEIRSTSGGFGISTTIENTGLENINNISWSIIINCSTMFLGEYKEGNIPIIESGESYDIKSGLILGFGPAEITMNVAGVTKKVSCFLLGPLVLSISD